VKHAFLKNTLILYLSTGVMAGIVCCVSLMLFNYQKNLENWVRELSNITIKTVKMKAEIEKMKKASSALHDLCPEFGTQTSKESLLRTADHIRHALEGSTITFGDIERDAGELVLPITIHVERVTYREIILCVGYLQTHIMPYVHIRRCALEQSEHASDSTASRWSCTFDIVVRMADDETPL